MKKIIFLLLLVPIVSISQKNVTSNFIDSIVNISMNKFPQAGVAIGVIQDGKITHFKGYGIASKNSNTSVDENTLFAIAWDYQDMDCDAFTPFQLDENGNGISASMKGISPAIDVSFDFQDLDLIRITE